MVGTCWLPWLLALVMIGWLLPCGFMVGDSGMLMLVDACWCLLMLVDIRNVDKQRIVSKNGKEWLPILDCQEWPVV